MKKTLSVLTLLFIALCTNAQSHHFTKITVASWNIGHFSLGQSSDTKLTHLTQKFYRQTYRAYFNDLNADILSLVEYNPLMVNADGDKSAIETHEAILPCYHDAQIGPKYGYNCNAIFSNGLQVLRTDTVPFTKMVQKRYYLVSTMLMDGDTVKVVSTHLDWNQGENGASYRTMQIEELIETFKNYRYVILCADWNTKTTNEYDTFFKAGYNMANHGYMGDLPTFPAGNPNNALDNIIVKGFAISHVSIIDNAILSDHSLIKADLTKLP